MTWYSESCEKMRSQNSAKRREQISSLHGRIGRAITLLLVSLAVSQALFVDHSPSHRQGTALLRGPSHSSPCTLRSNGECQKILRLRGGAPPATKAKPKIATVHKRKSAVEEWWFSHPFVTRYWFLACVFTTLISWDKLPLHVPVQMLLLYWPAIIRGGIWRLLTNFTYFGSVGHNMLMEVVFMLNFSKSMEVTYHGRRAQYLWHLILNSIGLLGVNTLAGMAGIGMQQEDGSKIPGLPFLAQPLLYAIVWIWARQNPSTQMSVFGFFTVKAVYYPWFLLAYHCVMGGGLNIFYLVGFVVGHIFFFLTCLHPQTKALPLWNAPEWLEKALPADGGATATAGGAVPGTGGGDGDGDAEGKKPKVSVFAGKGMKLGKK